MNVDRKIETSLALQNLFWKYTHLPLGGKEIVCPYWMNKLKEGIFGPYGGKGSPEQIVEATEVEATKAGLDLEALSKEEILAFMQGKRIGVDCSGFVFWMLDALDIEKGGDGISDNILPSGILLPSRANVATLTNDKSVFAVKLADVRVGDMIRLNKGSHVAIVIEIEKEKNKIKRLKYAHSSSKTRISGVHAANIEVIDQNKSLDFQHWEEVDKKGKNYSLSSCFSSEGDGLKRLKVWA